MEQKPSMGKIVLYNDGGGREYTAIVTKVNENSVYVYVLPHDNLPYTRVVPHEGDTNNGPFWRWPPRV